MIVPEPWLVVIVAPPVGAEMFISTVSGDSVTPSLSVATVIVWLVVLAAKVNVPEVAVKSLPEVAVPTCPASAPKSPCRWQRHSSLKRQTTRSPSW